MRHKYEFVTFCGSFQQIENGFYLFNLTESE